MCACVHGLRVGQGRPGLCLRGYVAQVCMCHTDKPLVVAGQAMLQAGLIVAGWDARDGGSVFGVPLGGTLVKVPFTLGAGAGRPACPCTACAAPQVGRCLQVTGRAPAETRHAANALLAAWQTQCLCLMRQSRAFFLHKAVFAPTEEPAQSCSFQQADHMLGTAVSCSRGADLVPGAATLWRASTPDTAGAVQKWSTKLETIQALIDSD